jgi:hypothetical protein
MKNAIGILAATMLWFAQVATAQAQNPPFLQGKYTVLTTSLCLASFTTTSTVTGNINGVILGKAGNMFTSTGYLTFTPTGDGTGGTFASSSIQGFGGGSLKINTAGASPWTQQPFNISGNYSATATSLTLGTQVFMMSFGSVSSTTGLANTLNLIQMNSPNGDNNPDCLLTINATRKQFSP